MQILTVNSIRLPVNASVAEAFSVARAKFRKAGLKISEQSMKISRRSVDARKKDDISFVYSVSVSGDFRGVRAENLQRHGIVLAEITSPRPIFGNEPLNGRPVVVGTGPCGLFAALMLAENGYAPIVLERGGDVDERTLAIERLNKFGILDENTNIQFGAGGAGTFSDGKLITRIQDSMSSYVLHRFVEFGAPEEIEYLAKPHIGTDILSKVVTEMLKKICELGGEVRYHTRLIGIRTDSSSNVVAAVTDKGDVQCGALLLAVGHSARDTYEYLIQNGFSVEPKAFSVGMRIEHLASDIDKAMYGDMAGNPLLGHAEYALAHNTKERGVYTFCMCPGGEVVAATSESGGLVVNGMSRHKRDGKNSNSAVVCSVFKEDYGNSPSRAIEFQRTIEKSAFTAGGGGYSAPIITVGDFLDGKCSSEPSAITPTYRDGKFVTLSSPKNYLPEFVCNGIRNAILDFDRKIKGFADKSAVLTGAETRTSAPIRVLRNNETKLAVGYNNLYPAGEGAGYAGGITSAAIDGIRCALALMERFSI